MGSGSLDLRAARAVRRLRRTGADLPFGDPRAYHGTAMEGYFWRISAPGSGTVITVMASVNRDAAGVWGTAAIAGHPGIAPRFVVGTAARARTDGLGITVTRGSEVLLDASESHLSVRLDGDTTVCASVAEAVSWQRRSLGGVGLAHVVPGLSQYWHPHLLDGHLRGAARLAGRAIDLDGAAVYAEKNWGPRGFPREWWWGQAHGFDDPDVCAAFAGGEVACGRLRMQATAVVARVGRLVLGLAHPLPPVRISLDRRSWRLSARTARHAILIEADSDGSSVQRLPIPIVGERRHHPDAAEQHFAATMRLTVRRGSRTVYRGSSELAGLERGTAPAPSREERTACVS